MRVTRLEGRGGKKREQWLISVHPTLDTRHSVPRSSVIGYQSSVISGQSSVVGGQLTLECAVKRTGEGIHERKQAN